MEKGHGKRTDTLQTDNVFTRKEYIEREALLADIEACVRITSRPNQPSAELRGANKVISRIEAIPAADVVPVRHGRWVTKKDACGRDYTICSACETEIKWRDRRGVMLIVDMQNAPYCPNCGARMDGDA